jgi:hypothetical protein
VIETGSFNRLGYHRDWLERFVVISNAVSNSPFGVVIENLKAVQIDVSSTDRDWEDRLPPSRFGWSNPLPRYEADSLSTTSPRHGHSECRRPLATASCTTWLARWSPKSRLA